MAWLSPARRTALALVSKRRRKDARMRDLARADAALAALEPRDAALAFRLAVGATAAQAVLDARIDGRVRKPSALEPRVRDALRVAAFEACYMSTPASAVVSQGVELVRSVSPRAAGLANAVLRRLVDEDRPRVREASRLCEEGSCSVRDISLASGLPEWLVARLAADRGMAATARLARAQREPAPVFVAVNPLVRDAGATVALLEDVGAAPEPVEGVPGAYVLGNAAPLATSGLVADTSVIVADLAAQLVCRIAGPRCAGRLLEVGQGRATKSLLLCSAQQACHPACLVGVDDVASKVDLARRRLCDAGLADVACSLLLDACELDADDLPPQLAGTFDVVLVDAPCSGTGTMRRHPEIPSLLGEGEVSDLAALQQRMLAAAATRVARGGTLVYATCSVLPEEDEHVVEAFLASEIGHDFCVERVSAAPNVSSCDELAALVAARETDGGYLLTIPARDGEDGHFCARLVRKTTG